MIPSRVSRVNITRHAAERIVQRARLVMTEKERQYPDAMLSREFKKSYVEMSIEMCPFKKNALAIKHGPGAFISMTDHFVFYGVYEIEIDRVTIKSCLYRPNSIFRQTVQ